MRSHIQVRIVDLILVICLKAKAHFGLDYGASLIIDYWLPIWARISIFEFLKEHHSLLIFVLLANV